MTRISRATLYVRTSRGSIRDISSDNMPILYGDGATEAFKRLQLQIIQLNPDQSIFALRPERNDNGLLANSPADFTGSHEIMPSANLSWDHTIRPFTMTNLELFNIPIARNKDKDLKITFCSSRAWKKDQGDFRRIGIWLERVANTSDTSTLEIYPRIRCHEFQLTAVQDDIGKANDIYLLEDEQANLIKRVQRFQMAHLTAGS